MCSVGTVVGTCSAGAGEGQLQANLLGKGQRFAHLWHLYQHQAPCQLLAFP